MIIEHVYTESIILEGTTTREVRNQCYFLGITSQLEGFTKNSLPLGDENSSWIPLAEQRWKEKKKLQIQSESSVINPTKSPQG